MHHLNCQRTSDTCFSILLLTTLVTCFAAPIRAEESWNRFRGPNGTGTGVAAEFPNRWTASDFNWRVELPGLGHSSPVIWDDRIVLQSADEDNTNQYVLCLSAHDGSTVWKRSFPTHSYRIHKKNSFASSSPAVDENHLYAAWSTPENMTLAAFDKHGEIVWQKDLGPYVSRHGYGSSPMLYQDMVIIASLQHNGIDQDAPNAGARPETSFVAAFSKDTGAEIWRTTRRSSGSVSYSVPCIYHANGKTEIICCSTADGMFSLNPADGKVNWEIEVFEMRTVSSPIVAAGLLFGTTGSGAGGNYVVAVKPQTNPTEAYRVTTQAPYVPTLVSDGELMFLWSDRGIVTCIEAANGKVIWRERIGGNYSSSPILVGDRLIGVSEDGEAVVLSASRRYKLLGRNSLGGPTNSTPAVGHGRIYFRTYSHLISIGGKT